MAKRMLGGAPPAGAAAVAIAAFDGRDVAARLPGVAGVYRMLGADQGVLYVGKARDLRKRVGSYFARPQLEPRLASMVSQIAAIEVTATRTESEALLLENELIKSLKPRYNVLLRDAKSYPYAFLSIGESYPRIAFHRGAKKFQGRYFGPFPSAGAVRESIDAILRTFRLRSCEDTVFRNRSRPCLQHQIGRCSAPCVGLIDPESYAQDVRHAEMFYDGRSNELIDELGGAMDRAAGTLDFERAASLRDQIQRLGKVQARHHVNHSERNTDVLGCVVQGGLACVHVLFFRNGISLGSRSHFPRTPAGSSVASVLEAFATQYYLDHPPPALLIANEAIEESELIAAALSAQAGFKVEIRSKARGERAGLLRMAERNAELALAIELTSRQTQAARWTALRELLGMVSVTRVECFDISHTMGEATVASCVVFGPEGAERQAYRRFNIAGITGGDDYAAMQQVLERRYKRVASGEFTAPDVLLIDGGAGQVARAASVLRELAIEGVAVVGVSKGTERRAGEEELVFPDGSTRHPGSSHAGLLMIQT
ncbi:MAG: excinuclease ABC subunit UvrC, partial [Lysobacterales bacterium]